jgi:plastocyanin
MKDVIMLIIVVAAFVAGGALFMIFGLLPEEHADEFRSLADGNMTFQSEIITISEPTPGDDTLAYAINEVAARAVMVATNSTEVKTILNQQSGSVITIAGVQPTVLVDSSGRLIHSSVGQVIITANEARIGGAALIQPIEFESNEGNRVDVTQQIWSVIVDLDKSAVSSVTKDAERNMQSSLRTNLVIAEMNVFMPHAARVDSGSIVRWLNDSNIPHNVVGTYARDSSSEITRIDSGFFEGGRSFQYMFDDQGTFEYSCTIHSEEGMKGMLVIQ